MLGKGDNLISTIHIRDLARAKKRIIDDDIKKNYIFYVVKTKRPSQKRIVQAISSGIGTGNIQNIEE
jgi:hypothetical protein